MLKKSPCLVHTILLGQDRRGSESTGGAESLGIDRHAERLLQDLKAPSSHPFRRCNLFQPDPFNSIDDLDQLNRLAGSEAQPVLLPGRHDSDC